MAMAPKKKDPAADMLKNAKRGAGDPNYVKKMTESSPKKPTGTNKKNPEKPVGKATPKQVTKPKAPATKPTTKAKPKAPNGYNKYKDATDRPGFLYGKGTI